MKLSEGQRKSERALGTPARTLVSSLLLLVLISLGSCKREERGYRVVPPSTEKVSTTTVSDLRPGGGKKPVPARTHDEQNAYATSEGQRLFTAYNCVGCHAHGGGGMGPPLMDDRWIYGADPAQVFATIVEGRPNGMPAFAGKIPDFQVWQLVAYVRSVGGLGTSGGAPGRSDEISGPPPPNSLSARTPKNSSAPPP